MARRHPVDACSVLNQLGIKPETNFFTVPTSTIGRLLETADALGYRKPKNANGSRGRYFFAYLKRKCF